MGDIENYLSRYTDRDDPGDDVCPRCGYRDCECDDDPDDCHDCGMCEECIDRSIAAAEEYDIGGSD